MATGEMTLCVIDHDGQRTFACDSVRLWVKDDEKGRGGGAIGIRRGHTRAVIALCAQTLRAYREGEVVCEMTIPGGIATVEADVIRVFVD